MDSRELEERGLRCESGPVEPTRNAFWAETAWMRLPFRACPESCVRGLGYVPTCVPSGDSRMDATLVTKADQLARELATSANTIEDVNTLLRGMMKSALERMLDAELDHHLATNRAVAEATPMAKPNRRNGHSPKTVQGDLGPIPLDMPCDRDGTFTPQLIATHQRRLTGFDDTILALYAKGMTSRDIQELVKELYGVNVSPTLISQMTDDLDAAVTARRTRRLDAVWPIVYLDGIVVHVRGESGRVSQHTMYVAIGVNLQGRKELLGWWLSETEGVVFWLGCLTDWKNRGGQDLLIVCVDELSGFPEAIRTAYPQAKVQLCIVH